LEPKGILKFQEKNFMQGNKIFLDTNIIVYAYDTSAGKKHEIAQKIMMDLWDSELGVLSTQVLQEFFVTVTKKIPKPLDAKLAKEIIKDLLKWDIVVNDGDDILEAIETHLKHKFSFWDSMIIQAAVKSGVTMLLSEDLPKGKIVRGVTIKNPFG